MHKLSVPFMLAQIDKYGVEVFIDKLKEIGADIVFLALDAYETDEKKQAKVFDSLKKNVPIFQKAGFIVGVWVWTFMVRGDKKYTHITSPSGAVSADQVCPSDEEFCDFAQEYMRNIAKSNPDMIMFDDDFRYGFLDCGLGCTCKNHRAYMSNIIGEEVGMDGLANKLWSGGRNKYRSAWLKANGHYFKEFARKSREAVDSVNPQIRLGACSCLTSWDLDGVTTVELAHILAGKTKPFARLIGAAYWAALRNWGNHLQDVIELERMEIAWCNGEIEIFAEGDAYPRPRFACSANDLEGFDMALRAAGGLNGIHKYTLDYYAEPAYEDGYNRKHLQNQGIYKQIEEHFTDKTPVGVRVYESMNKFEDMDVPAFCAGEDRVQDFFFSFAARMLAAQTIPTVYNGLGVAGIAFGENVKYLEDGALDHGLILDISAAKILKAQGVDVGLEAVKEEICAGEEYFIEENRYIGLFDSPVMDIAVSNNVKVNSYFIAHDKKYVGSYTYENAKGQKFLVFAFEGYNMGDHVFRQPMRGQQIVKAIKWMGKTLPAEMLGNPDCYMLCKENETQKAVWIGNFFADECMNTRIILDKEYKNIHFINCKGVLNGNIVDIEYIPPRASVGFIVE